MASAGLELLPRPGGGGSDSNVFNLRGLSSVNLGVGFEHVHSPQERMALDRLEQLYELAHGLVRVAGQMPREG